MTLKLCIRTVGCRTNQADSLALELAAEAGGARVTGDIESADVVLVNSCAVTARAARDTRRLVSQARRLAPAARVIVTGCLVEVEGGSLWHELGADRIVRNADKMQAAAIVSEMAEDARAGRVPSLRSFRPALKVQEGCTVGCAYCIVPRTRGPERSIDATQVVAEVRRLASLGAHEVVFTGTQLGAWGSDLEPRARLADLVERVVGEGIVRRLRLSSIEPWGFDEALLEVFSSVRPGLCHHVHVPLQTASAGIHEAMGRPGGPGMWSTVVRALAEADRPLAIGTDVMVGFPGEGPSDFEMTVEMLERSPLAYLHVFPFSPRPGTRAARMQGRPADADVRSRVAVLRDLSRRLREAFLSSLVGRRLEVIAERMDDGSAGVLGTSDEFARVLIEDGGPHLPGRLVSARAARVEGERVVARLEEVIE